MAKMLGMIPREKMKADDQRRRVWSTDGECPTLMTPTGGYSETKIAETVCLNPKVDGKQPSLNERVYSGVGVSTAITTATFFMGNVREENEMLRIRKLTEGECMRLMGFQQKDTEACEKAGLSRANIYHQSGDSIVVPVLMAIFGEALGIESKGKIEEYCDGLHEETL